MRVGAFDVDIVERPGRVELRCAGDFDQSSALELYQLAFERASALGRAGILIDARDMTGEPTMTQRFEQGAYVADLFARYGSRIRVAVVGREPLIDRERFGELVATNRLAPVRVFTQLSAAIAWLEDRAEGTTPAGG